MTRLYKPYSKQALHYIAKYQKKDPFLTEEEAYQTYLNMMRLRSSKGGQAPVGGFNVPGVAQKAAYKSAEAKRKKNETNR